MKPKNISSFVDVTRKFRTSGRAALLVSISVLGTAHGQTNGTWTQSVTGGNWSDSANWAGGVIANGGGATANFSTLDLSAGDHLVNLDTARTVTAVSFHDGDAVNSPGTWTLGGTGTLTLANPPVITAGVNTTFANTLVLAGTAGFTKEGAGLLNLTNPAAATLTGAIHLNSGTLALFGAAGGSGEILAKNGTRINLSDFQGNNITVAAGARVQLAANGYGGLVSGTGDGILEIAAASSFGSGRLQQFANFPGTVVIPTGSSLRFSATGGNANATGGANTTFDVNGTIFTRNLAHQDGVILGAVTGGGVLGGQTNAAVGTVIYRIGDKNLSTTFAGTLVDGANGTTSLRKAGDGKLTLTGDSPATGAVTILSGSLSVGDGGATGSLAHATLNVSPGASLIFNRSGNQIVPGIISGGGAVIKRGSGTTAFTSAGNTHFGGTDIEEGTLEISKDSHLGDPTSPVRFPTGSGVLASNAAGVQVLHALEGNASTPTGLAATHATDALVIDAPISGGGGLSISGQGVVEILRDNPVSGAVAVQSGTLVVSNPSGSATGSGAVSVAGSLAGAGFVSGDVTVASGGLLRPGAFTPAASAIGTLQLNSLNLTAGSILDAEFSTTGNDLIELTGSLDVAGASAENPVLVDLRSENSTSKWSTPGSYRLVHLSGTLPAAASQVFKVSPDSTHPSRTYVFSVVSNTLVLTIAGGTPSAWKVNADGTWATASNWTSGVPNANGASASLGSIPTAPRAITLASAVTVGDLSFANPNGYTIRGSSPLNFQNQSIRSFVSVLDGTHSIATAVQVNAQGLEISLSKPEDSLTLGGQVSGSGSLIKDSPGSLVLNGNNTGFNGGVRSEGGTISFLSGGLGSGPLYLNNTTLVWNGANQQDITIGRNIAFGEGGAGFEISNSVTLSQPFGTGSAAALFKRGSGTLTLSSLTGYTGATHIEEGEIRLIGNGDITGDIVNNGGLVLGYNTNQIFSHPVSGTGYLIHEGTGLTTLDAPATFSGRTEIRSGEIRLAHPLALQNSTLIANSDGGILGFGTLVNATLGSFQGDKDLLLENEAASPQPVALTLGGNGEYAALSGRVSGAGSLIKIGTGTLSLENVNSYTGTTEVRGGNLDLSAEGVINSGALTITSNGRLTSRGHLTASGPVNLNNNPGGFATARLEINDGTANFPQGINATGNGNEVFLISVNGGSLTTTTIGMARSSLNLNAGEPVAGATTTGLYVTGGQVHLSENLYIGTVPGLNIASSVSTRVDAGSLTVNGLTSIGVSGRWSVLDINGGTYDSTDAVAGLIVGGPTSGNAVFLVRAGRAKVERIQLGQGANTGTTVVRVNGTGELYVGAGGIVLGSTSTELVPTVELGAIAAGNLLGAKASWSTNVRVNLTGIATVKAADDSEKPFDLGFAGPVTGSGALVKTGGGTLDLTAASSYTGNTTVLAGTLRLSAPTLADTSTVDLAGGTLRLDFNGADHIAALSINGTPVTAEGTYGAIDSGADHPIAGITGTGLIQLGSATPVSAYQNWIAVTHGLTGAKTGPNDDYDGDGVTNLVEFALDSLPNSAAASGKIGAKFLTLPSGNAFVYTLPVRTGAVFSGTTAKSATVAGVIYRIEGSTLLGTYDQALEEVIPARPEGLPETLSEGWSYRSFRLSGKASRGFLRAGINSAP